MSIEGFSEIILGGIIIKSPYEYLIIFHVVDCYEYLLFV